MGNEIRALRGMRFTLFVYSVMVWGWGYLTLVNIQGIPFVLVVLLPLLLALPLFLSIIRFSNHLRGLAGPKLFKNSRAVWLYVIGLVVTVGGYVLAVVLARALHHPEYTIPIATLVVGLHFLFIALAFDAKRTYSTVAVFCLTALLVPLTIPLRITIGLSNSSLCRVGVDGGDWNCRSALAITDGYVSSHYRRKKFTRSKGSKPTIRWSGSSRLR